MEEIFEPRPSTSTEDIQLQRDEGAWVKESDYRAPRKLSFIPRISQYERHPLLQERSASGLSQFDELTNLLQRQKSFDLADCDENDVLPPKSTVTQRSAAETSPLVNSTGTSLVKGNDDNSRRVEAENASVTHSKLRRLEPRGALCERHPLLEKSESGMSELEMYLIEKEQELLLNSPMKDESVKNNFRTINEHEESRRKQLQPRQNQYEKHALLESRDEQGLSPLDYFLHEKERLFIQRIASDGTVIDQEEDSTGSKGKCSEKCVCKNATCVICKPNHSSSPMTNHTAKGPESNVNNNIKPEETKVEESLNQNMKSLLIINQGGGQLQEEIIDLRRHSDGFTDDSKHDSSDEKTNCETVVDNTPDMSQPDLLIMGQGDDNFDDLMRSHPPLMKKESSRETMIEPKDTNKRVHFERTLSEKEREMKAISAGGDAVNSQGLSQNKINASRGDDGKKKKRLFPWWGRRGDKLCGRETSPDCGDRNTENVPLVEELSSHNKDKNENDKKTNKKHCVIL